MLRTKVVFRKDFFRYVSLICITIILLTTNNINALAQSKKLTGKEKQLAEALILYKQGKYNQTMEKLHTISGDSKLNATVRYWKGLVRFKQQKYDLAIVNFEKALELGSKAEDIYYQLGQSYYAAQKLDKAITAFKNSASKRYYKISASAYYIGYIYQLRDEDEKALSYYERISRLKEDPDKVKQPAIYQTAEIHFDRVKEIKLEKERVDAFVEKIRPLYKRAYDYDNDSLSGKESKKRLDFIDKQAGRLAARERIGKSWKFKVEQDIRWDSNVVTKADDAVVQVSNQASMVSKTTGRASYRKKMSDKWQFDANSKLSAEFHTERSESEIIENDAIIYTLGFSFDRKNDFLTKDATHTFGFDFNYTMQDHRQTDSVAFFSKYFQFFLQEELKIWNTGESRFKLAYKYYDHHLFSSSNVQFIFSWNQKFKVGEKMKLSTTLQSTWLYGKQSSSDTIRYELNNRLPIPFEGTDLTLIPYIGFSLLDTRENQPSRGWEKKLNGNLTLRKNFNRENRYILKFGYDFTRNFSQDTVNQQYYRHQVFVNGAYRF